jgi:stage II sporulation protein M
MAKRRQEKKGIYTACWSYIKESRNYFYIILVIFLVSVLVGFFFPVFFKDLINQLMQTLTERTKGMGFLQLFSFILQNNATTAFTGLILGLAFGLFPLVLTIINGYVLGYVSGKVSGAEGVGVLFRLLPHGIFELPALIISLGLGLKLGMFLFSKNPRKQQAYNFENSMKVFLFVIIPLLIIAAFIEAGLIILLG